MMENLQAKRPSIVLAAAILLFVFGGFGLLGICAPFMPLVYDLMPQPPQIQGQPQWEDPMKKVAQEVPNFNLVQGAAGIATFLLGVIKIWAGFGVLQLRRRARTVAIVASIATVVLMIAQNVYNAIFFIPVYTRLLDEQVQKMGAMPPMPFDVFGFMKNSMWVSMFAGLIFSTGIWFTIVFMLCTKSARNAFAGVAETPAEPSESEARPRYEGYEDDDEGYPRSTPPSGGDTGITNRPG